MFQQITIVGNLGRDPEMRYTPSGKPVTNFSVAVNRKWTNADGTQGEEVTWFKVAAWGKMAETCNQYLSKGRQVMVVGTIKEPKVWTGQDGTPRASLEVNAQTVKFLGGARQEADAGESTEPEPGLNYGIEEENELPF